MTTLINTSDSGPQAPRQIRFVHSQGQPPSKRRRINAACLTCRRRKTRCAGERPLCSTCTRNGHECLGYPEDKKEGGDTAGAVLKAEEDDQEALEDEHVEDYPDANTIPSAKGSRDFPPPSEDTPEEPRSTAKAKSTKNAHSRTHNGDELHSMRTSQTPLHLNSVHDTPYSPTAVRRLESHRVPYFRYFGPTAIVPGFKQMVVSVRDRHRSTGASIAGTSPLSSHSAIVASSSAAESDVVVEDLPIYDPNDPAPVHPLILDLVNIFFVQMGSSYPFLRQAKFLQQVKEKRVEAILVDSVCALAARFSDAPALTGGNDKMPRTERGNVFAQRARQATVDTFPCPTVGAVQALLLMAYEGFGASQDSTLWMYLGLAIRMAVDLGLQKEVGVQFQGDKDPWYLRNSVRKEDEESPEEKPNDTDTLSPEEQKEVVQERKDTFWAVFILDRLISSGTGRPVTIHDEDFELELPEPYLDPVTRWPAVFPVFLEIIHLYGRVSDVLNKIRNVQDLTQDKWDKLNEMERDLTKIYKGWDSRLQFNVSNFKAYLGFGQGPMFILLHFWFHALLIILHQPTLLTPFGELRGDLQLLADSRELSMSSAKTICDILSFADLIDPKSFIGNPFTNQPMYIAACAFLMESNANASGEPSRASSPQGSKSKTTRASKSRNRESKPSRHSLLASVANQNYQRCYSSLQQVQLYWGGVTYILTALDQKVKGIWDCETYTTEEYESTKVPRRESRGAMGHQFPRFESRASPKITGPPIAWSLSGTANSPNSSLTLMYQNFATGVIAPSSHALQPNTPPGNMVYDPIRQSLPETGTMYPVYPQPNTSAVRLSPRPAVSRRMSSLAPGRPTVAFDRVPEEGEAPDLYLGPRYTPTSQTNGFDAYSASPPGNLADAGPAGAIPGTTATPTNMYYPPSMPYPTSWGPSMGNMDSITFDSQDIDINALQQDGLSGSWLDYIPHDVLGLFENPDMGQGGHNNNEFPPPS